MSLAEPLDAPERVRIAAVARPVAAVGILVAVSASHMLNDMMQSLAPALYPVFRDQYSLTFFQTGLITLVFQVTASLLQPFIGLVTDRRPAPWALPFAMAFTLFGLVLLAFSRSYPMLLVSVAFVGVGSAVFHPEASRAARAASGGRHGFAQSLFQVGGNFGQSLGPLMAAFIVVPNGQISVLAFTALAFIAILLLARVAQWQIAQGARAHKSGAAHAADLLPRRVVWRSIAILVVLLFSKTFYLASINSYYTFYLIETFHVSVQTAQVLLFVFLGAVAAGTFAGGPIGDRIGRKYVIWASILGVLPFTLLLPHLGLIGTVVDSIAIGLILSSAFAAMVVYAQELAPGNVGAIAGLFFGLSFGLGGLGAAALGLLADHTSLAFVYQLCGFLPAIGLLTYFLPDVRLKRG
ncbi:MAG: MFS transporter [Pseudomonadota bacterium]|nr:MFS transporter [Pseudomonadota bacterium]